MFTLLPHLRSLATPEMHQRRRTCSVWLRHCCIGYLGRFQKNAVAVSDLVRHSTLLDKDIADLISAELGLCLVSDPRDRPESSVVRKAFT
jgi:hypothetical protein